MSKDLIKITYRTEVVGIRTLKTKYIAEVLHSGLNDFKIFSADDHNVLTKKINAHLAKLEISWNVIVSRQNAIKSREDNIKWAEDRTRDALEVLTKLENILLSSIGNRTDFDLEDIKDKSKFNVKSPNNKLDKLLCQVQKPIEPKLWSTMPIEPKRNDFNASFAFWEILFKSKKQKQAKIDKMNSLFTYSLEKWESECKNIALENEKLNIHHKTLLSNYEKEKEKIRQENNIEVVEWENEKREFYLKQNENNSKIDKLKVEYLNCNPKAITEYCELILSSQKRK